MLNAELAKAATEEVLRIHSIPSQVSEELRDLLDLTPESTAANGNGASIESGKADSQEALSESGAAE